MLKPYSIRKEFLLTLIVGGVCALLHYIMVQPEHFEESVHVFANSLGISSALIYVANDVLRHPKIDEIQDRVRHEVRSYVTETVNRLGQFDVKWQADVPIIWLNLPNGWRTTAFCQAAEQAGVLLSAGEQFVTRQTTAPHAVRLCVNSEYGLNRYLDGISTLAELLRNPDGSSGI